MSSEVALLMLNISLEIARGLAALWVFFYHIRLGLPPGPFRLFCNAGFLGVPAFFVISGYCMMASSRGTIAKKQPAWSFLKRRLRRIFPPFWASIVLIMAMPFLTSAFYAWRDGGYHWPSPRWYAFSWGDWLSLATLTKGLFWTGPAHKPWAPVCAVYWSLAIEVQFYLVMWAALFLRRRYVPVLAAVTAGCIALWRLGPYAPGFFPQYWAMFALGLGLFLLLEKGIHPARLLGRWALPVCGVGFAALTTVALRLVMYSPSETLERQTLFATIAAGLFWLAAGIEPAIPARLLPIRAFVGLGKMSYSVYLLHIAIGMFVTLMLQPILPQMAILPQMLYVAGALTLIWVFYFFCERPFATAPRKQKPAPQPEPVEVLAAEPEPVSTSAN